MKKWILTTTSFLLISLSASVWAGLNSNEKAAQNVIENWFAAMKEKQMDKAASFLAPQFISIHTDGIARNKTEEMELIKNLNMQSYHLSNFSFSKSGNVIVVTYKDQGSETIDSKSVSTKAASRMAVLQNQNGKWVILAYSNLDKIG
ncbi:MAG: nuclear transport factor 2 family protein [Proteobacteria bacterium]|nr:nuclear transport factor 2 family protein [Pseudomonadota bacterium]